MPELLSELTAIEQASRRLDSWIEQEEFRGWDPHDALNSPLLKACTFGRRLPGIVVVQLFKRSPINFRPLLGVPKLHNAKGMGLFLASYLRKYRTSGETGDLDRARFFASWLEEHVTPGYSGPCWAYPFDWPNRGFSAPAGTPTIVNTGFIGLSLCDHYANDHSAAGLRSLQIARGACDFVLRDLARISPSGGELCFSYTPIDRRFVHNANAVGALLLTEVFRHTGDRKLKECALHAARYTATRIRSDGSWAYGEGKMDTWADNFHTGFVLVSLKRIQEEFGVEEFEAPVARGYEFWKNHFFLTDGTPKFYPERTYPIDVHSVAQSTLTFLEFAERDPQATACARRTALWGIRNMQDRAGYFHYQLNRCVRNRIPYMRWGQAWIQRAFAELLFSAARPVLRAQAPQAKFALRNGIKKWIELTS